MLSFGDEIDPTLTSHIKKNNDLAYITDLIAAIFSTIIPKYTDILFGLH